MNYVASLNQSFHVLLPGKRSDMVSSRRYLYLSLSVAEDRSSLSLGYVYQ